ncbi:MAG: serine/threonine-protein kinase [Planctomycetota bacterium]
MSSSSERERPALGQNSSNCPEVSELIELTEADYGNEGANHQELLQHIEQCEHCRQTLEWLAGDESWWNDSRELLADTVGFESHREQTLGIVESICALANGVSRSSNEPLVEHEKKQLASLLDPPSHPELLGRLGRYELEQLIGRGGMGLVFRAFDTELHRVVAVKTLAIHLTPIASARERFVRESRACAALVHPHVVPIYDVLTDTPVPALVMHYVAGPSLEQTLAEQGALDWRDVVTLLCQLADALHAAHEQGLVHRDIKPGNVLLEADASRALLADFGLVRALDDATLTHSGFMAGTPDYMSPEQARGEPATKQSDLYSMGALAYAMLTGAPPFRSPEPLAVLNRLCNEDHEWPSDISRTIPRELRQLIDRLLAKSPTQRVQQGSELRDALVEIRRLDFDSQLTFETDEPAEPKKHTWFWLGTGFATLICVVAFAFAFGPDMSGLFEPYASMLGPRKESSGIRSSPDAGWAVSGEEQDENTDPESSSERGSVSRNTSLKIAADYETSNASSERSIQRLQERVAEMRGDRNNRDAAQNSGWATTSSRRRLAEIQERVRDLKEDMR